MIDIEWLEKLCLGPWPHTKDAPPRITDRPWRVSNEGRSFVVATDAYSLLMIEDGGEINVPDFPEGFYGLTKLVREPKGVEIELSAIRSWCGPVSKSPDCKTCLGTGKIECSECKGRGWVDCECDCGDRHEAECDRCGGEKSAPCPDCEDRKPSFATIGGRSFNRVSLGQCLERLPGDRVLIDISEEVGPKGLPLGIFGPGWHVYIMPSTVYGDESGDVPDLLREEEMAG